MSLEFEIPLVSLIFILILNIVYFSKKRADLEENKPYKVILICLNRLPSLIRERIVDKTLLGDEDKNVLIKLNLERASHVTINSTIIKNLNIVIIRFSRFNFFKYLVCSKL